MSLMDQVPATPEGQTPPAGEGTPPVEGQTPPTNDWYYDENIKGNGERPEWLKDKYKSAADQAKAYGELEKKLGAFKGAPEKYDLTLKDFPELKFSEEDPMIKNFIDRAKENGVSQEYVSELLTTYAEALTANVVDSDAELKKIGPNAAQDLQILGQWASQHLSAEEFGIFKGLLTTADAFKIFDTLRNKTSGREVAPPGKDKTPSETVDQVKALINDPRWDTDESFRQDVRRRLSIAMAKDKSPAKPQFASAAPDPMLGGNP